MNVAEPFNNTLAGEKAIPHSKAFYLQQIKEIRQQWHDRDLHITSEDMDFVFELDLLKRLKIALIETQSLPKSAAQSVKDWRFFLHITDAIYNRAWVDSLGCAEIRAVQPDDVDPEGVTDFEIINETPEKDMSALYDRLYDQMAPALILCFNLYRDEALSEISKFSSEAGSGRKKAEELFRVFDVYYKSMERMHHPLFSQGARDNYHEAETKLLEKLLDELTEKTKTPLPDDEARVFADILSYIEEDFSEIRWKKKRLNGKWETALGNLMQISPSSPNGQSPL